MKPFSSSIHCRLAPSFSIVVLWVIGRRSTASWNISTMRRLLPFSADLIHSFRDQHTGTKGEVRPFGDSPSGLDNPQSFIFFILFSLFVPFCEQTQVKSFKKSVSNSATQDSIMNEHNKIKFTYAKIKCALKDSSCDSPISKNLMLAILASNASSSSTILTQDKKGLYKACNGAECKGTPRIHVRSIESTIQVIGIDRNRDLNFAKEQPYSTHERWQKCAKI
ncbi:hypothetical protein H5410_037169 [Solanum commersonii]|uniref:Uncharacterized protein n=1 Tax=Solanum commersonii TaxID=4109 RepID=A0A9J5Y6C6_SOLCO|nr:hypothetical protein H5410_037169 [Solanum commersonii]